MSFIENFLNRSVVVIADEVKENKVYKRKLLTYICFVIASTAVVSLISLFCINIICMYLSFKMDTEFVFNGVFVPSLLALSFYILTQIFFGVVEWKKRFGVNHDKL